LAWKSKPTPHANAHIPAAATGTALPVRNTTEKMVPKQTAAKPARKRNKVKVDKGNKL